MARGARRILGSVVGDTNVVDVLGVEVCEMWMGSVMVRYFGRDIRAGFGTLVGGETYRGSVLWQGMEAERLNDLIFP